MTGDAAGGFISAVGWCAVSSRVSAEYAEAEADANADTDADATGISAVSPGTVTSCRTLGGIGTSPASAARSEAMFCGRSSGRTPSIHATTLTKRGETPGTTRCSIGCASGCTARAVAGAGGTPNSK